MKNSLLDRELSISKSDFIDEKQMAIFFNVLTANVERTRTSMVASLLTFGNQKNLNMEDQLEIETVIGNFLQSKIRKSDLVCKLVRPLEWCIILTQSGEKEAIVFIERMFSDIQNIQNPLFAKYNLTPFTCINEINNSDVTFDQVINISRQSVSSTINNEIIKTTDFKDRKKEKIKVSILEDNEIFAQALYTTVENIPLNEFELDMKIFSDGYEFLQSNWFYSSHTHIILVNDILPRNNGLEVVHRLREMPNNHKYLIFMMTKRKSEQDMIHAFKSGVDEYLIKPFNIRLFEAQLKRVLQRL
ncbi:response regulator transcription factor [Bacillus sp. AGMB 02131]|uniref:Response regulator transcription factor n=1 Tax=Peribacillus faecalis TaxID=2772559 RepID=A0A927CZL0_9BACI|nr:response regulator [Peribacillus faecalis]MBD3108690.1 response regulator transcription factor [Peribacillus faecalis]